MTLLQSIRKIDDIPTILSILMSADNALDYNKEDNLRNFPEGTSEVEALALRLCGNSYKEFALEFMQNNKLAKDFFINVSYNKETSIPRIIRAINIATINQRIN